MKDFYERTQLFRLALIAVCGSAVLSGCANFEDFKEDFKRGWEPTHIGTAPATTAMDVVNQPGNEMSSSDIARGVSSDNVEVYGLDRTAAPGMAGTPGYGSGGGDGGMPSLNDPSVTIYPLDGGGWMGGSGTPGIVAPSGMRQGFDSPFDSTGALEPARVYFQHNSSLLNPAAKKVVGFVAENHPAGSGGVRVEGHASARTALKDPVKAHMVNLKVSMDRALSVSRELIRKGVPAEAIETKAWGDTRPALSSFGGDTETASRRVEIYTAYAD